MWRSVRPWVVVAMKELMMKDQNTNMSNSFLLDDDSSIHFTIDDISGTMSQIDLDTVKVGRCRLTL